MKIEVSLAYNDPHENMTRIRNVIMVAGTRPKAVFMWMNYARPPVITDAGLQKIFGIVDAAMSVIRGKEKSGYDFDAAMAQVNAICKSRIGEVN